MDTLISGILKGSTSEILKATGYDKRQDGHEIIEYYGKNNKNCYALKLYDVTEFEKHLTLKEMRSINSKVKMPQYYSYIYSNDPLYNTIKEWDEAFSLDGNLCKNPDREKKLILQRNRERRNVR